jgi:hypothetical protein
VRSLLILIASLIVIWLFLILSILDIPNIFIRTRLMIIAKKTRYFLFLTSNLSRYKRNILILRSKNYSENILF